MQEFNTKSQLRQVGYEAIARGNSFYNEILGAIKQIQSGSDLEPGQLLPSQMTSINCNAYNAIICATLEMLKYEFPEAKDEYMWQGMRGVVDLGKQVGEQVARLIGVKDVERFMHQFKGKFTEVFTVGWFKKHVEDRKYTREQVARIIDSLIACARRFMRWLCEALKKVEKMGVADETRPVEISRFMRGTVVECNRESGLIVLRDEDWNVSKFRISSHARLAWRVIRLLVETEEPGGSTRLFKGALQQFRNNDAANNKIENDLSRFARYIHSVPEKPGWFCLKNYPKAGYAK